MDRLMYKSSYIRYDSLVNFGKIASIGASMLLDDPSAVINDFQELGALKNKYFPRPDATNWGDRLDNIVDDTGATIGVLTSALGAGVNKYGNKLYDYAIDKSAQLGLDGQDVASSKWADRADTISKLQGTRGDDLKRKGVDIVTDAKKRRRTGERVVYGGAMLGSGILGAGLAGTVLLPKEPVTGEVTYSKYHHFPTFSSRIR